MWYSRYAIHHFGYVRWVSLHLAHASQVLQAVRVGATGDYTVRLKYSTSSNATLQLLAAVTLQSRKVDQILQHVAVLNDSIQHVVISSGQGRRAPQQDPCTKERVSRQVKGLDHGANDALSANALLSVMQVGQAGTVHHVGKAKAACDAGGSTGLRLPHASSLVAPVVIVAHDRVHYLAKCLMTVLRQVGCPVKCQHEEM